MPDITAIISAYYCEKWIHRRIENLISQFPKPKIILIGLKNSPEIQTAEKYPEIVIIETPNTPTLYETWNIGIENSTTPYICNANADDLFIPGGILTLLQGIQKGYDYFAGSYYKETGTHRTYVNNILNTTKKGPGYVSAYFTIWKKNLGLYDPEYKIRGDVDFQQKIIENGKKIGVTSKIVGIAWAHGMSSKRNALFEMEQKKLQNRWNRIFEWPK